MISPYDIAAAFAGGFAFLTQNYLQCSATELMQTTLVLASIGAILHLLWRERSSARLRSTLTQVNLSREPKLRRSLARARLIVAAKHAPPLFWAPESGPQLAILGYWRPALIISPTILTLLDSDELDAALAHELEHARRGDALRIDLAAACCFLSFMTGLCAIVLYFAFFEGAYRMSPPLAAATLATGAAFGWAGARALSLQLSLWAEFASDLKALAGRGGPAAVASALVKVARLEGRAARSKSLATCRFHVRHAFHRRVYKLLRIAEERHAPRRRRGMAASAGVLVLLLWAATANMNADLCESCALVSEKIENWSG